MSPQLGEGPVRDIREGNVSEPVSTGGNSRRWILTGVCLIVIGIAGVCLQMLRFWNLRQDVELLFVSHRTTVFSIPTFSRLWWSDPRKKRPLDDQAILIKYLFRAGAVIPGSCAGFLSELPNSEEIWKEVLDSSRTSLAFFPLSGAGCPDPLDPGSPTPAYDLLVEISNLWLTLAIANLGKCPSIDVATVILGAAMMGLEFEAIDPRDQMHKRMGTLFQLLTVFTTMQKCAPGLGLSLDETRKVISFLEDIDEALAPLPTLFEGQKGHFHYILDLARTGKDLGISGSSLRSPGKAFCSIAESPAIASFVDQEFFGSLVRLASESMVGTDKRWKRIEDDYLDATIALAQRESRIWRQFAYDQPALFKAGFLSWAGKFRKEVLLTEPITRQTGRMARWSLALFGFREAKKSWPKTPGELEVWLGRPLPGDCFSYGPVLFNPGDPPDIRSIGPDQTPFTDDDIRATAIGSASVTAFLEGRIASPSAAR